MLKSLVSSTQCEVGAGAYQQDLRAIRKACVDFLVLASRKVATAGRKTSFVGSHSLSLSLSLTLSLLGAPFLNIKEEAMMDLLSK